MGTNKTDRLSVWRLVIIALYGFALTVSGNTQDPFLYTHKVSELVPGRAATALGFTTAAGLVVAVVTQPIVVVFSDRTRSRWGRRPPLGTGRAVREVLTWHTQSTARELEFQQVTSERCCLIFLWSN